MADEVRSDGGRPRYLRVAGRTPLGSGRELVWSMAEGSRGRRWRASVLQAGELLQAVLLEVTPAGRPGRLELSTAHGSLTLHPEPDERSIHGNVVDADGVRPLALAWSPAHELDIVGLPLGATVALARRGRTGGADERVTFPVLVVDDELVVAEGRRTAVPLGAGRWRVTDERGGGRELVVDAAGLIEAEATWDLEPEMWEGCGQEAQEAARNGESRG